MKSERWLQENALEAITGGHQPLEEKWGGMLCFRGDGVAACCACGWRGVATYIDKQAQTECPACERDVDDAFGPPFWPRTLLPPRELYVPGRNQPCPCGSGIKYKKCCGR